MNAEAAGTGWLALDKFAGEEPEDDGSKLVVLSFFASWCGPCKKEMPFLAQLDKMYRDQGLRIIGVCIDTEEPGLSAAKKMIADNKVSYPVVSDRFNFLARRYLGESAPLPSVFLVRRDGTIARIERGYSKDVGAFLLAAIQQELGLTVTSPAARPPEPAAKAEPTPVAKASRRRRAPRRARRRPRPSRRRSPSRRRRRRTSRPPRADRPRPRSPPSPRPRSP